MPGAGLVEKGEKPFTLGWKAQSVLEFVYNPS